MTDEGIALGQGPAQFHGLDADFADGFHEHDEDHVFLLVLWLKGRHRAGSVDRTWNAPRGKIPDESCVTAQFHQSGSATACRKGIDEALCENGCTRGEIDTCRNGRDNGGSHRFISNVFVSMTLRRSSFYCYLKGKNARPF